MRGKWGWVGCVRVGYDEGERGMDRVRCTRVE